MSRLWCVNVTVEVLAQSGSNQSRRIEGRRAGFPPSASAGNRPAHRTRQPPAATNRLENRMLSNIPKTEHAVRDVMDPHELIPLTVLELDLQPPSTGGWVSYLASRGIAVLFDDIGRRAIHRDDARQLITEQRHAETRQREAAERQAAQLEQQRLASLRGGVPADRIPEGVPAATWMLQAAKDAEPKRRTVLEEALDNDWSLTYHPIRDEE